MFANVSLDFFEPLTFLVRHVIIVVYIHEVNLRLGCQELMLIKILDFMIVPLAVLDHLSIIEKLLDFFEGVGLTFIQQTLFFALSFDFEIDCILQFLDDLHVFEY